MEITYPPELPVTQRREDIAAAIRDHQVVIVAGETGSGKTTQMPKICLELGRGRRPGGGLIGHTQPRRIAARSVAERIAEELGTELGDLVGYQVRFTDRTSKSSRVKLMTDGILLAELQRDRQLRSTTRSSSTRPTSAASTSTSCSATSGGCCPGARPQADHHLGDHRPGAVRRALRRPDGKPAPIIEVSGRTYPVEVRYRPLIERPEEDEEGEAVVRDQTEAIVDAVRELSAEGPGDILVFLPGEREIRDTAERAARTSLRDRARGRAALLAALGRRAAPGLPVRTPAAGSCSPPTSPRRR